MPVVSALIVSRKDEAGNPRTEGWVVMEFSGAYAVGGQAQNLSPYFRGIEQMEIFFLSGGVVRAPISGAATIEIASGSRAIITPVRADYGSPVSARFLLGGFNALSGTGPREDVLSGLAASVSGIRFGARILGF